MTRARLVPALLLLAAVAAGALVFASRSESADRYRVDVVFDDSRGLIEGQLVQIAGARVGTITDVTLTRDFKARVHMEVDGEFGPFRRDATCTIKPQGLIAENYVDCDPGTPDTPALKGGGGVAPTVPVERTSQPVALTDLFEIWNAPTRDRLGILLATLGIGTAARGEDFNEILRRANPTLEQANDTIATLSAQRDDLATIVDATAEVAAGLAERPEQLTRLVDRAAAVTTRTARVRDDLGEGLRRMPALLREARPSLQKLDATMDAGEPLLEQLEAAAPSVNRVSAGLPKLAAVAAPALRKTRPVFAAGAKTARTSAPLINLIQQYASSALPNAKTAGAMFTTLEDRGFVESFIEFLYNGALAAARYDESGHILPAHVTLSFCGFYATSTQQGCGAGTNTPPRAAADDEDSDDERKRRPRRDGDEPAGEQAPPKPGLAQPDESAPEQQEPVPAPPAPAPAPAPAPVPTPTVPTPQDAAESTGNVVTDLLDFLLGG